MFRRKTRCGLMRVKVWALGPRGEPPRETADARDQVRGPGTRAGHAALHDPAADLGLRRRMAEKRIGAYHLLSLLLSITLVSNMGGCRNANAPVEETRKATTSDAGGANSDPIRVSSPAPGAIVTSPLKIRGQARGSWYFEADFPISLVDESGRTITKTPAKALGNWMTSEFVPFEATLEFTAPASAKGFLVLEKANASGLPEHDAEVRVPVRFE
jgi:Immunoglobulin-like domain of bacterial spore germination